MNDTIEMPPTEPHSPPPPTPPPYQQPRRITKGPDGKIAGVCDGVARYFEIDPLIVRIVAIALVFAGGVGLIAYIVAWFALPDWDGTGSAFAGRDPSRIGGVAALILGALVLIGVTGFDSESELVFPILLIGIGVWLLTRDPDGPPVTPPLAETDRPFDPAVDYRERKRTEVIERIEARQEERHQSTPLTSLTFSAAAVVVGIATLGDQLDWFDVPPTSVLAAALTVLGVGLLVGVVVPPRPRMVIPVGIMVSLALAVAWAADPLLDAGVGERDYSPHFVGDLATRYELGIGALTLDLRSLDLAGFERHVAVDVGIGEVMVIVPEGLRIEVDAHVGAGDLSVLGREVNGFDNDLVRTIPGDGESGTVVLDAELSMGSLTIAQRAS